MLYRFFRLLAKVALSVFFRRIEVEGRQHVPDGPVLCVANHANALVDPLLLVISLRRRVTVTAKNVLGKNPILALLMKGLGVVTFHRREDIGKGAEPRQNIRSLRRCREILAAGGAICIFPEGVSHSEPRMRPFRTGPARIALDFVRGESGSGSLAIVPVGLLYTDKDRFRSGVWLRFAPPLDVTAWHEEHPEGNARDLTDEIRRRVERVTLNYESDREALLLSWAADIVATRGEMPLAMGEDDRSLAEFFRLIDELQEGYHALRDCHRDQLDSLIEQIRQYRGALDRRGVDPAEVFLPIHLGRALLFFTREAELVLVGLPLAAFGVVNHIVPYQLVKTVARKLSTDKDHWASNMVYPGFLVFPFFYAVQVVAAWLLLPAVWAAVYTVALPFTGYYALLYRDRIGGTWRRTRTFFHWLRHRDEQAELAREGREIIAEIERMRALLPPNASAPESTHVG